MNNKKFEKKLRRRINKPEKKKRKQNYKFSDKKHPAPAVISFFLSVLVTIIFISMCIYSGRNGGQSSYWMGAIGICLLLFSILGFFLAVKGFKKEEIHYLFPVLGLFMNGSLTVLFSILYALGAVG